MKLKTARSLEELRSVLKNPQSDGPDPTYFVYSQISQNKWNNMTILPPGDYDGEFVKTFGHYHNQDVDETYKLVYGQGILMVQKPRFGDDDWIKDCIEKVYFIEFSPGDEIVITPEWAHSWSNIGNEPLITFDNWNVEHSPQDYEIIKNLKGMCYYLVKDHGSAKFIPNSNYVEIPKPQWISAKDISTTRDL